MVSDGPYRTPAPPETPEQEYSRLSGELGMLQMQNVVGLSMEQIVAGKKRVQFIRARLVTIAHAWDREAWWRALSDEQRCELMAMCCSGSRSCGKLKPSCRCWNDD